MTLYRHELKTNLKQLIIWSLSIGIIVFFLMLIYPEFSAGMGDMTEMMKKMGSFSKAFGLERIDMNTATGYYAIESGTMIAIGGALFAALIGTGMLAKEEANHTAEFLLTTPNARKNIITQKLLALISLVISLNVIIVAFSLLGFLVIGESVDKTYFIYHIALLIMQIEIACLCFGISAFLKRATLGLGIGISLVLYFSSIISNLSDQASFLNYFTPFYYADGSKIFEKGEIEWNYVLIGVVIIVISTIAAYVKYMKKDINS